MIHTIDLIPELDQKLIDLLRNLRQEDWTRKTVAPKWNVKEVVSHILDGTLRGITFNRDTYFGTPPPADDSYAGLVQFLNQLNAQWVDAFQRVSPALLVDLLTFASPLYYQALQDLDPEEPALFSVAWAGEEHSKNWFHIAREYTEKFHHQLQIRQAVGQEDVLYSQHLYLPYLDTSMQALPHHYKDYEAKPGTVVRFEVDGIEASWYLSRVADQWKLVETSPHCNSEVHIPKDMAWLIFTKGISRADAKARVRIEGDVALGEKILDMIAVMA